MSSGNNSTTRASAEGVSRGRWPRWSAAVLALVAACGGAAPDGRSAGAPASGFNLLVFTFDTTRPDYLSPFGADPKITPHLAALAERSWLFTNAVSETNITNPSHLTIFSGQGAIDHGLLTNDQRVPAHVDTLPELFRRTGYRTAGFPAAPHVGPQMGWRGFDVLVEPPPPDVDAPDVAALAQRWIDAADDPFFAWVHFFDPHALYAPPEELREQFYSGDPTAGGGEPLRSAQYFADLEPVAGDVFTSWLGEVRDPAYPLALYEAELHYADRELGRLLDALDARGELERTVVIVVADHGESLGEHGIYYDHKGLYEPQLRIPLMISAPGFGAGECASFVTTLDLAPTIEELFGIQLMERRGTDTVRGRSLVPVLRGEEGPEAPPFFVHQNAHNHVVAVREGPWKLLLPINKRHKVLNRGVELFDLASDPGELVNVVEQHPERAAAMRERARPWLKMGLQLSGDRSHLTEEAQERLKRLGYE